MKKHEKLVNLVCEECKEESYIELWKVGINKEGELCRLCPNCSKEVKV